MPVWAAILLVLVFLFGVVLLWVGFDVYIRPPEHKNAKRDEKHIKRTRQ